MSSGVFFGGTRRVLSHPTPLSRDQDSMSNQNIADHESSGSERQVATRVEHAERSVKREQASEFGDQTEVVTRQCADCAWSVTQPTAVRADSFARSHEERHSHEMEARR